MTHVDDLIKRRKQQVFLAIIPRLAHRIPQCRRRCQGITNHPKAKPKTQESEVQYPAFLQNRILHQEILLISQVNSHFFTDDYEVD
ncbi:hypothetical protein ACVIHI_008386 [Bradyrhizobium sp. USDA 4524]|uniref:hypothetical protein n=1 Tax=unclassified Bradyrhizobium TaxID=2631580 RepID=UPI00209DE753|nr:MULTISPECIES: hypothetical protein [unclassified Bradyrhizobium]MCP1838689.1 hypothetical protein [Bradyrhizobium sp. USDA 4538]MCP1899255.1 hypothetical protein [Bradyrhizobium sp. USDA 4537]MCP1986633.1 hypothetical protein [Bradyrhizobium sp. USDA 4539]